MNRDRLLAGELSILRAHLDLLIAYLEGSSPAPVLEAPAALEGCPHPDEKRVDASTMGGPSMVACTACGAVFEGIA